MLDIEDGFEHLFGELAFPSFVPIFWAEKWYRKMCAFSMVMGESMWLDATHPDGEPQKGA